MDTQVVTIKIPTTLYHRLNFWAQNAQDSVQKVVVTTLDTYLPPLPDENVSLTSLESLNDEGLWQVARRVISPDQQKQLSALLEKNQLGRLTNVEEAMLNKLSEEADQRMLRKAKAYVLLKQRGYELPTLAELEAAP